MLPPFHYHRVESIGEAVEILAAYRGEAKILAGGTDLLLQMQRGQVSFRHLVSMRRITAMTYLYAQEGHIILGANTTHRQAELSPLVQKELGALHDAVSQVGSVQVRNVATVAGNLCTAVPSADSAAPLLALGAALRTLGPQGERMIPLANFFQGLRSTALREDEVLHDIRVPRPPVYSGSAYLKLSRRRAMDIAIIGVATYIRCSPDKARFEEVRIALSTVAPTPIRAYGAEKLLSAAPVSELAIKQAAEQAAAEASPRTSLRSTAEYRREMIKILLMRSLRQALDRVKEG
jgi:CO/xanthine dehydrogenase FAD-binding subunit